MTPLSVARLAPSLSAVYKDCKLLPEADEEDTMPTRAFRAALLAAASLAIAAPALAQTHTSPSQAMAHGWEPKRNAMGQPDFSGAWGNESLTPFERPVAMGTCRTLTPEEVTQR